MSALMTVYFRISMSYQLIFVVWTPKSLGHILDSRVFMDAPGGKCYIEGLTLRTRHVLEKHGCPRRQQSQNMAKISTSYILTPPHPRDLGVIIRYHHVLEYINIMYIRLQYYRWFWNLQHSLHKSQIFRSWVAIYKLRPPMVLYLTAYTICPGLLLIWMFYSKGYTTFK